MECGVCGVECECAWSVSVRGVWCVWSVECGVCGV